MRRHTSTLLALVLLVVFGIGLCVGQTHEDHRVTQLPGYGPLDPLVSYAGYMKVTSKDDDGSGGERKGGIFYWFYEKENSTGQAVQDIPIVLWVNGGPGCSAMIGCFEETIGPFTVGDDLQLTYNPHTWIQKFHVLFIDQPLGTGFSYAGNEASYTNNEKQVSLDMYHALHSFFQLHPKYKDCDLYLAGESYAGKYLPEIALRIVTTESTDNHLVKILKGVAIGDGFSSPILQRMIKGDQAYFGGLISQKQNNQLKSIEAQCIRSVHNRNTTEQDTPCAEMKSFIQLTSGLINNYDIRRFDPSTNKVRMEQFLNLPETREAIHATEADSEHLKDKYVSCNSDKVYYHLRHDIMRDVRGIFPILARHIKVLLFSGNFDLQDGPVGTEHYVLSVANQLGQYSQSPRNLWFVDEDVAGYEQTFANFTFISAFGSGHFYPLDQQRNARSMMESFTSNRPFCSPGQSIKIKYLAQAPDEYLPYLKDAATGTYMLPCEIHQFVCQHVLKSCHGHGKCVGGMCQCDDGYTGEQCLDPLLPLARRTNSKELSLEQQQWKYHKLNIESNTFDQNVLKFEIEWKRHGPNGDYPLEYQIGEGLGTNLPMGKVCMYGKKNSVPTWNSFDFVMCEQSASQIHVSAIVDLGNLTTTMPQWWIGVFNAQPDAITYSIKFDQDFSTHDKPVNILTNFKFWIALFSVASFIAFIGVVGTIVMTKRAQNKNSFTRLN